MDRDGLDPIDTRHGAVKEVLYVRVSKEGVLDDGTGLALSIAMLPVEWPSVDASVCDATGPIALIDSGDETQSGL